MIDFEVKLRLDDEALYGKPEDRRRGYVEVTDAFLFGAIQNGMTLPRMTRVAGVERRTDYSFNVLVESPDIPPPAEDGALPTLSLHSEMHSLPKDRMVSCLSPIVQYATTAEWEGRPETKAANFCFQAVDVRGEQRARLLKELGREDASSESVVLALAQEFWGLSSRKAEDDMRTTHDMLDDLTDEQKRRMLHALFDAFWGI